MKVYPTVIIVIALSIWTGGLRAYEREKEEGISLLKWYKSEIPFYIDRAGSPSFSHIALKKTVEAAFYEWNKIGCKIPKITFEGFAKKPETDDGLRDSKNMIIFRSDEWYNEAQGALALTTVLAVNPSGEIIETDIEFNSKQYVFSVSGAQTANLHDFENTLVHEIGHVLGLDHPDALDREDKIYATMAGRAQLGEFIKRSLDVDDVLGVCSVYLYDLETDIDYGQAEEEDESGGCSVLPR